MWVTDKSLLYDQITTVNHYTKVGRFSLLWYNEYAACNFITICAKKKPWKGKQYSYSRNLRPYFNDNTNSNYVFSRVLNCEERVCLLNKVESGILISALWKSLATNKYLLSFQYFNGFLGVPSRKICSQEASESISTDSCYWGISTLACIVDDLDAIVLCPEIENRMERLFQNISFICGLRI